MESRERPPEDTYWQAIEPVWQQMSIYDGPDVFLDQLRSIQPEQGHLFAAHWCHSEVCNGGFHQFFTNPTGVLAPEAAAGFRAIGLEGCAKLIEQAMAYFGLPYPREHFVRVEQLERVPGNTRAEWDPFYQLDDAFYRLLDEENGGYERAANDYARRATT